jgi:hypothetical protein
MSSLRDPATILFGPLGLGDRAYYHTSGDSLMASESGFLWTFSEFGWRGSESRC